MRWLRAHPRFTTTIMGLFMALGVWAGVEILFRGLAWWRGPRPELQFTDHKEGLYRADPRLGFALQEGAVIHATKERPMGQVFAATYTIDEHGRRETPQTGAQARPRLALFFGGSFTFGEGAEDDETLPAQFAGMAPAFHTVNYACNAYGPQQMWLQVTAEDFAPEITQTSGVAYYVFIDHHLARLAGSMQVSTTWGADFPCITLEDGQLINHGSFETARPIRQFVYRIVRHLPSVEYFYMDWPPLGAASTTRLFAALCAATHNRLKQRFPGMAFSVVLYPGTHMGPCVGPALTAAGVEYHDFSTLFTERDTECFLADGHPSAEGHRRVAEALAESLAWEAE